MISYQKLPQWLKISLAFPLIFLNAWLIATLCQSLQPLSSIVLAASLVAFLLDYPISFLERRGLQRIWAIGLVLLLALVLASVLSLGLLPIVFQQLQEFGSRLPAWFEEAQRQLPNFSEIAILQKSPIDLNSLTTELTNQLSRTLQSASSQVIDLAFNTINSALELLLILVLTLFLVFNGKPLWTGLLTWLPAPWNDRVETALRQSFQGYFAGQATIATIQSIVLMTVFLLLQIPFGLLFGLTIGLASLIPFGGSLSIALISSLLALQNIWLGVKILLVAILVGQINENVIAPRLIGSMTGLNPAIVFISLLMGAKLGGVLGLLLVVPIAGFIKRMTDSLKVASGEV
ncbi:MAG: AI-2E family transporter [Drouetiella hepatica Uher 2000/2452]|jgi:predicted PurR-regulated permease PerM|uniref:AI-2E family transporter n=1 Tax=Drouetiella hepatica Uher 2000/2452 TaxID=904376 RepID=A0A951QIS5_9CYAN|nr:AI-2E family transporter [Drouetiella hepatica Uher 2000/2452]